MNFSRDVVDAAPPSARALVALARDGARTEWSFGDVAEASARAAGALVARGVGRGEVVMTLVGNRPEWVLAMLACFRIGAVVLPCTEQLRPADLRARVAVARPRLIVCDERNAGVLGEATPDADVLLVPGPELTAAARHPPVELEPEDPCLVTFTSGTAGEPKAVLHGQRYLTGQRVQAEHWLAPRAGRLAWCTAASGWSKSARNVFIAPWLRGAAALLHDARFDPQERLEILEREQVDTLCMAPTEYRVIAKRVTLRRFDALRGLVAAGEALNPEVLRAWHEATGLWIRDGYGQTETGQLTGNPIGAPARPGSMGKPVAGIRAAILAEDGTEAPAGTVGHLCLEAGWSSMFRTYLGDPEAYRARFHGGFYRTGDEARVDADGHFWFVGRSDDVINTAGHLVSPFEVESALLELPAVVESAVVGVPDPLLHERVVAFVHLREPGVLTRELELELRLHVSKRVSTTATPQEVVAVPRIPKNRAGKILRRVLRARHTGGDPGDLSTLDDEP